MTAALIWSVIGFVAGSIPFSVLLGRYVLHIEIRAYGDGNPGAANVQRAGGARWGVVAILLDSLKGAIPAGLAFWAAGISGWQLVPVTVAPVLGHAFSPFLALRGGKAIAATFGVWAGVTLWQVPTVLGLVLTIAYLAQDNDGWAVMIGMTGVLVYLAARQFDAPFLAAWVITMAIVAFKHRRELRRCPRLRARPQADHHA